MADHNFSPVEVPAPQVVSRARGLLTDITAPLDLSPQRPTDVGEREYDPATRAAAGVAFCSDGCGGLTPLENTWCSETTLPEDYDEAPAVGPFSSFWVQTDDLSPLRFDDDHIRGRLRRRAAATFSAAVERELLTGAITGNPSLVSTPVTVVPATTPIDEALYVLEDLMAAYDGMRFVVHTSPGVFELLIAAYDIEQDDKETADDPNRLPFRLPTGHIIVGDAGLDGSEAPDGESTDSAGEWIYAHAGSVLLWESGWELVGQDTANIDRTHNTRSTVYGQHVLVAFDPCASLAVQVDVPTYTAEPGPGATSGD